MNEVPPYPSLSLFTISRLWLVKQVYLLLVRLPPPQDLTVALCLETYGDPCVGVSYERGTPVIQHSGIARRVDTIR